MAPPSLCQVVATSTSITSQQMDHCRFYVVGQCWYGDKWWNVHDPSCSMKAAATHTGGVCVMLPSTIASGALPSASTTATLAASTAALSPNLIASSAALPLGSVRATVPDMAYSLAGEGATVASTPASKTASNFRDRWGNALTIVLGTITFLRKLIDALILLQSRHKVFATSVHGFKRIEFAG